MIVFKLVFLICLIFHSYSYFMILLIFQCLFFFFIQIIHYLLYWDNFLMRILILVFLRNLKFYLIFHFIIIFLYVSVIFLLFSSIHLDSYCLMHDYLSTFYFAYYSITIIYFQFTYVYSNQFLEENFIEDI
jgi:hypothetical protein